MQLQGVVGRRVDLPCNISSGVPHDIAKLVIWYKNNDTTPIFRQVASGIGPPSSLGGDDRDKAGTAVNYWIDVYKYTVSVIINSQITSMLTIRERVPKNTISVGLSI